MHKQLDRFFNLEHYPKILVERYCREVERVKQNQQCAVIEQILKQRQKYKGQPTKFKLSVFSYLVQHSHYELCEILHKWTKINQGVTTDIFADFDETLNKYHNHKSCP